jgi:hypothetical protein
MMKKACIMAGGDGWLNAKYEPSGLPASFPNFLQVEIVKTLLGRDYFKPTEGLERGNLFSVPVGNLNKDSLQYQGPARLTFSISKHQLTYAGHNKATAKTDPLHPIALGAHPIQLPDFPHEHGRGYTGRTPKAMVWFYLGIGAAVKGRDDRYLHPGRYSAGCVTVEIADWDWLCVYLLLCRAGDGKNVGTLTVVS